MSFASDEVINSKESGRQYRIVKVLGHGAFGEVLLAQEQSTQEQYAVKQLYLRDHDGGLPQAVNRELSALQQLQHPNIVRLLDVAAEGPCLYLIQELCKTDLAALLYATNWHLPGSIVRSVMQQLLRALAEVHARGLMHRDVKPSNVLFSTDGEVKLADFGLARSICTKDTANPCGDGQHQQQEAEHTSAEEMHLYAQPFQEQRHQYSACHSDDGQQDLQLQPGQHYSQVACIDNLCHLCLQQKQSHHCISSQGVALNRTERGTEPPDGLLTAAQGTRWYRAPELLYGSRAYGVEVDMWSAGMVLAEMLGLAPFIPGQSDIDQLARMQQILGSITLQEWPEAEQLPDWHKIIFGHNAGQPLQQLLPDAPAHALDLLRQMIVYNPSQRITAVQALEHEYLADKMVASHAEVAACAEQLMQQEQPRAVFN